ncbi:MAG: tRNA (adenosine(37)-N6)-dimethylallyltransferase MiaA [Bryobacteraceae bacterium]
MGKWAAIVDRSEALQTKPSPLVVVLGPTGAGKSELGLALAEAFDGEIINCDSVQVYRGLQIGTAKLRVEARRGIPHHLIDILSPDQELTAAAYSHLARNAFDTLRITRKLAIVVGGTGFYLKALIEGLSPAPSRDERLRARLGNIAVRRPLALYRFLRSRDPEAASRIHPNDHQKLIRAIELTLLAGQPATITQSLPRNSLRGFEVLRLGLAPPRILLYERLNQRSAQMFESGLIEETEAILDAGFSPTAKPLQSLGYKQAMKVIANQMDVEEAIRECQTKTRQYAKRQITWFHREPNVNWLPGFGDRNEIQQLALAITEKFLRESYDGKLHRE